MPAAEAMRAPALLKRCTFGDTRGSCALYIACRRRDLSYNQLTGEIPDSLASLSSLVSLCAPVLWLWRCLREQQRTACMPPNRGGNACSGAAHALCQWSLTLSAGLVYRRSVQTQGRKQ
jgi:hypothetical protein